MAVSRGRILAVDHGEKRIGLALSDESNTIATPLGLLKHISRTLDAARVAETAHARGVALIVVGQSLDEEGFPNAAGRSAGRFGEALRAQTGLPIVFWDESLTTQDARAVRLATGASRKKRGGHLDDLAAAVLLQSYLDSCPHAGPPPKEEESNSPQMNPSTGSGQEADERRFGPPSDGGQSGEAAGG